MAQVELRNVKKKYGEVTVVHDLNLVIKDKEFLVLVGPSGCGKSTTLRMIAGLEEITEGELYIDNKKVNHILPKDRDIAMVFQNYALYSHMTVYENMAFGLKMKKMPKDEIDKIVRESAKILNLEELFDRKPKALSGGQRQRVALGRAIVRQPKVFLMDEPLSNLDAKLRVHMRTEISKLHKRLGATIVYVTHDQTEAMTMGDRIVVMKDGYVQQVDTPMNIYERPANIFVAGFIGSPAMNFMDCKLEKKEDHLYFVGDDWSIRILPEYGEKLANYIGEQVILGIRPENLHIEGIDFNDKKDFSIDAQVEVVEPMGSESYYYLKIKDKTIIARVSPNCKAKIGDTVKVYCDPKKTYVFDKKTEKNII